jgi:hypothetical protein
MLPKSQHEMHVLFGDGIHRVCRLRACVRY